MKIIKSQFSSDWYEQLKQEFNQEYFRELKKFLSEEYANKTIYPQKKDIFNAFKACSLASIKVVIIGQDPYHGEGQAHGLAFSVHKGVKVPPSLKNIYKELHSEFGFSTPSHGNLSNWSEQGVLLLNNVLTVEASKAGSHQRRGWEKFTDKVITILNDQREDLVFLLWGKPAQKKCKLVDDKKHHILTSVHPSPLSAYRGFFGCDHFKEANKILKKNKLKVIDWEILD